MKKVKRITAFLMLLTVLFIMAVPVLADDTTAAVETEAAEDSSGVAGKGLGAGIAIAIAAGLGALGMGIATGRSSEAMARQPEKINDLRSNMIVAAALIEGVAFFAIIIALLALFV